MKTLKQITDEAMEDFDSTFKDDTAGQEDVGVIVEGNNLVDCERIKSFLLAYGRKVAEEACQETLREVRERLEIKREILKDCQNHTNDCPYHSDKNKYYDCTCGLLADDTLSEAISQIQLAR